jgi:predicted RNA-binding protein with PUA-like domain
VEGAAVAVKYWLMKSEPDVFSFGDLERSPDQTTCWDGVRNYQARNLLRDEIKRGDRVLFYHSRTDPPAAVGTARVVRGGYPDPTQFDRRSKYFDAKSSPDAPRWFAVDIRYERPLQRPVTLEEMRAEPQLRDMVLVNNSRLSVQPVQAEEWRVVDRLARRRPGSS